MPVPPNNPTRSIARLGACAAVAIVLAGCQAPPRSDLDAAAAIAAAGGLASPIDLRMVGPDGGPLDEPEVAGAELTAAEALRRALTTDPGLQSALARVRIALAEADQARLLPNPVVNAVIRWGPGTPQIEVSLAQDVLQALQIPRRASAADHRLRQAACDALTAALEVILDVQERYAAVQASAARDPLLRERLMLVERLVKVARARLEAGEGSRSDLATLEVQQVQLQVEIAAARRQQREDRLRLARLIGEPSSAAAWSLEPWTSPDAGPASEARWVQAALAARPEVQAIRWQLAALGDEQALASLAIWEGGGVGVDAQRDPDWTVGPSISTPVPLFDMGQARRDRVTAEQLEARHNLTAARRKVVEDVRVAMESLRANGNDLQRIRTELIPLQRQRQQYAEQAYRAGQSDVTALFLAEQDLRVAESLAVDGERSASVAWFRLLRAAGGAAAARDLTHAPPSDPSPPPAPAANPTDPSRAHP